MNYRKASYSPALLPIWILMVMGVSGILVVPWRMARADEVTGLEEIQWTVGPAQVDLGSMATLEVPAGYRFTGPAGSRKWAKFNQNPSDGSELGVLLPPLEVITDPKSYWFMTFSFAEIGYVKDDEKGSLDAATATQILQTIQKGTEEANQLRRNQGWATLTISGWEQAPFYDTATHHLTWATRVTSSNGAECVNYDSRVLGRRGVMQMKMILPPERVRVTVPTYRMVESGITFRSEESYKSFRSGDKVAQYGLTALITGGGAVAAVKLWKPLLGIGVVIVAFLTASFKKIAALLTGRKQPAVAQVAGTPNHASVPPSEPAGNTERIVQCHQCGQSNRVKEGRGLPPPVCGRCHALLSL